MQGNLLYGPAATYILFCNNRIRKPNSKSSLSLSLSLQGGMGHIADGQDGDRFSRQQQQKLFQSVNHIGRITLASLCDDDQFFFPFTPSLGAARWRDRYRPSSSSRASRAGRYYMEKYKEGRKRRRDDGGKETRSFYIKDRPKCLSKEIFFFVQKIRHCWGLSKRVVSLQTRLL